MRTLIPLLVFVLHGMTTFSGESYPERPDYTLISKTEDSNLKNNQVKVVFQIEGLDLINSNRRIVWSANEMIDTVFLNEKEEITKTLISGKYNFKFYHNSRYREIIIPKMNLESGFCYTFSLIFKNAKRENISVKKPVIYLYPENETEVNVRVNPTGELGFTYPEYPSNGWTVNAKPNGDLIMGEQTYNYLFWESEQVPPHISADSGFVVRKETTVAFLESVLDQFGLNSKEKADFITFWGPQLIQNESNFIQFHFNEECNSFAELTIQPQPEKIFRIYLLYANAATIVINSKTIQPQIIPQSERSGFTVIEWGGFEIPMLEF